MPGFSNVTGDEGIVFADNVSFDGTERKGKITTDGQLLIGSTAAPHIKTGFITSSGSTVAVTNSSGAINLDVGATVPTTFQTNSGNAISAANVLKVFGSGNIATSGAGNTVTTTLTGTTDHAVQIGNAAGTLTSLGLGTNNTALLGVTGGDPIFGQVPNAALSNSSVTINGGNNITVTGGGPLALGGTASVAVTGTTDHALQVGNASGSLTSIGLGTNNTALLGVTGGNPVFGTVPNAALTNSSITVSSGTGLTGGGTVALGGSTTLSVNGSLQITTGFATWGGAGNYFDDTTLGSFTVLRPGTGYINTVPVSWTAPQTVSGMTAGNTYLIYIDNTGTLQKGLLPNNALIENNIGLFQCLRDSTSPTNTQITVKENHPFNMPIATYDYLDAVVGTVIENDNNGANITLNGTQKIQINGADVLSDNGLTTIIPDSGGVAVTWRKMFTNAGGKWAVFTNTDTFTGNYNNAGTVTALGTNKFGVYRLFISKDTLNSSTPTFYAVLDTQQYNNQAEANTAVSAGTAATATAELAELELAQLGFITYSQASASITAVTIAKSTLRSSISGGPTPITTTQFDVLVGGPSNSIVSVGPGTAGQVLQSGGNAANPAYSTPTYPSASGTAGKILISDGTNNIYSTPTYPNTSGTAGKVLVSDGTNNVYSTPTFPNASATLNKIIKSDGTNWIASTETYAAPGTSGNILTSDGTNWTSAAPVVTNFPWTEVTGTSQAGAVNNGYILNNAGLVTLTLPATSAVGSVIRVVGKGAGKWRVAQPSAGSVIHFGSSNTTTGVTGRLDATLQYDCVDLICITANADWVVNNSVGNITIT